MVPVKFTWVATGCTPGVTTLTRGMEVRARERSRAALGADALLIQTAVATATATATPAAPSTHFRRGVFAHRLEHQYLGFAFFLQLRAHETS